MVCNRMFCRMKRDIDEDPMYWIGASFFSGVLFSSWSWGILYLISFLILYEIMYYVYCYSWGKLTGYDLQIRIGMVAGAMMGFLIGRCITEDDDHDQSIKDFCSTVKKYIPKL